MLGRDPRVTVLMPVYNGERFLDESIASVVGQDFDDLEFVIVDDASTDATSEIIGTWAARDPRIVPITLDRNGGISRALNRGLEVAKGEYIARQDADDIWLGGRLRAQVATLDADAGAVLVSANYQEVDEAGRRLRTVRRDEPPEVTSHLLRFGNAVCGHGQVLFRRDLVRSLGGYDESYAVSQDYELWTRLDRRGRIVILPIVGMKHRVHREAVTVVEAGRQRHESLSISRRALGELLDRPLGDEEVESLAAVWRLECRSGHAAAADRLLAEAFRRFQALDGNRRHHRRVRMVTAGRWVTGAAHFAVQARPIDAASYLGYAARWHPVGAAARIVSSTRNAAGRLRHGTTGYAGHA